MNAKKLLFLSVTIWLAVVSLPSQARSMIDEFSWHEYTSPARDQRIQGPCHAFAEVGLIEAAVRLYYNRPNLQLTLSPKHAYSILSLEAGDEYGIPSNNPYSSSAGATLAFAEHVGLVREAVYPWQRESPHAAFYFGINPDRARLSRNIAVKIPGYRQLTYETEEDIKRHLLHYGPIAVAMSHPDMYNGTGHGFLLIGWRMGSAGETEWELLDSWPQYIIDYDGSQTYDPSFQGRHYFTSIDLLEGDPELRVVLPYANGRAIDADVPYTRRCHDNDGDGYPVWGIGPKPAGCAGYNRQDGDDSDPALGPRDRYGHPVPLHVDQELNVVSQGSTATKYMTVQSSGTFHWSHNGYYDIPNSGYYMRVRRNGSTVAHSNYHNRTRSGSFYAYKGQTITVQVRGGTVVGYGGYTRGFHGSGEVHN